MNNPSNSSARIGLRDAPDIKVRTAATPRPSNHGAVSALLLLAGAAVSTGCATSITGGLDRLKVPLGFKVDYFAKDVPGARMMTLSPSGTLFVGTMKNTVYALRDDDGDGTAENIYVVSDDLSTPNGVAFKDGSLYVGEIGRILRFDNIEARLQDPPEPVVVTDAYPTDRHHGWKFIAFGPDGYLYVPVGAPCNVCESEDEIYASLTRIKPDGTGREIVARGIRNTVGFTWHPSTKELWFTDNGRDWLGDDMPPCELNRITRMGQHFGYPYCHAGDIADPDFGQTRPCSEFAAPARRLGPHVAPLGLRFYTGEMFPKSYRGHLFIAEHGSWNRKKKIGYRVSLVKVDAGSKATSYEPFVTGWLDEEAQEAWGRPSDVQMMPDGSLLVSDDKGGAIYRVTYRQ
ncbi:MAG: PQQ-dependent sugar dehydrogenase [Myxococcota bacterium]